MENKVSRRRFLGTAAAGAAGLALSSTPGVTQWVGQTAGSLPVGPATREQPNIVWLLSDEHNWTVTNCYQNASKRWRPNDYDTADNLKYPSPTPTIDAMSAAGVTFDNHYCNAPLCCPSRASITTCKYPSEVGVYGNTDEITEATSSSIARAVAQAGYGTFLCGKQHYAVDRRYGFKDDPFESAHYFNSYLKNGTGKRFSQTDIDPVCTTSGRLTNWNIMDHPSHHDRLVTEQAVGWLSNHPNSDQRFFLLVGMIAPHPAYDAPQSYLSPYLTNGIDFTGGTKIGPPSPLRGDTSAYVKTLPINYQIERHEFEVTGHDNEGVDPFTVEKTRAMYFARTAWMDNNLRKILDVLDTIPNTVVIYSTDHGESMGEHSMWFKNCMFEPSAHVPLVIRFPTEWTDQANFVQRKSGVSSHVDLVQTIVELAGGTAPPDWRGKSMLGWIKGTTTDAQWKNSALCEYYGDRINRGFTMWRNGDWKYVYHIPAADEIADEELYWMGTTPNPITGAPADLEITNLAERNVPRIQAISDLITTMQQQLLAERGFTDVSQLAGIENTFRSNTANGEGYNNFQTPTVCTEGKKHDGVRRPWPWDPDCTGHEYVYKSQS